MFESPLVALVCGLGFLIFLKRLVANRRRNPRRLPHPPGPKGLPFLGNLAELNQAQPWELYDKLCEQYGASQARLYFLYVPVFKLMIFRRHGMVGSTGTRNYCTWFPRTGRRSVGQKIPELLRQAVHSFDGFVS